MSESSIMSQYLLENYKDTTITIAESTTGSELITNGTFASSAGWTLGTGWTIGSNLATHATGNATSIYPTTPLTIHPRIYYRIEIDITTTVNGELTFSVGENTTTISLTTVNPTLTDYTIDILTVSTENFTITSDSSWGGSITNVSVKLLNLYNENGMLEFDENYNYISSSLIGTQSVFKCSTFTGVLENKYVVFYNADNELLGLIKGTFDKEVGDYDNIRNNFSIKNQELIYYKINATVETKEFSGSSVTFSTLDANEIFKIYLNGDEITSYSRDTNTITFDTGIANLFGNNVFIIYYPASQSLSGVQIDLHYYSPYKHEVVENSYLGLGYGTTGTSSVSAGSNIISTDSDLTGILDVYDFIRIDEEVKKILYINATTIKTDTIFENTYSGETLYYIPYKFLINVENESENLSSTFYEFKGKGVKMPIKIKEETSNKFSFDYDIDQDAESAECNVLAYITDNIEKYIPENNRMRIIRTFYNQSEILKFIYLTNVRKIDPIGYTKSNPDKYSASFEFEDKLTLEMNLDYDSDGILDAGGLGRYRLIRS